MAAMTAAMAMVAITARGALRCLIEVGNSSRRNELRPEGVPNGAAGPRRQTRRRPSAGAAGPCRRPGLPDAYVRGPAVDELAWGSEPWSGQARRVARVLPRDSDLAATREPHCDVEVPAAVGDLHGFDRPEAAAPVELDVGELRLTGLLPGE